MNTAPSLRKNIKIYGGTPIFSINGKILTIPELDRG